MSRLMLWNLAAFCALAWGGSALADRAMGDLAPFPPEPPAGQKLIVRVDPNAEVSKLILPAALNEAVPAPRRAPRPDDGAFWSPTRTMMAGLCLSLAVVSLFFIRTTSGGARMLLIAVAGLSAVGMGAVAWADIPPFPGPRPPRPQPQPVPIAEAVQLAEGRVVIEYTDKKDAGVTLILSGKSVGGVFRLPPGVPGPRPNIKGLPGALPPAPGAPAPPRAPAPE